MREGSRLDPIRPGAYDAELRAMEEKLEDVKRLLAQANMTGGGTEQLSYELNLIRYKFVSGVNLESGIFIPLQDFALDSSSTLSSQMCTGVSLTILVLCIRKDLIPDEVNGREYRKRLTHMRIIQNGVSLKKGCQAASTIL